MAPSTMDAVKVVEQRRVSPPPGSVPPSTLTLTFFDVIWLQVPAPVQRLFFYDFSGTSTEDFRRSEFPLLARSLSLALSVFYPLAGRLVPVPGSDLGDLFIRYSDGDSVPLTLAESNADYHRLVGNQAKDASESRCLVPDPLLLSYSSTEKKPPPPLVAFQVTVFPGSGVSVGFAMNHVAADGSSSTHFMKSWAAIFCRSAAAAADPDPDPSAVITKFPVFDRRLVGDLHGRVKPEYLEDMKELRVAESIADLTLTRPPKEKETELRRVVRCTFVLTRSHVERLREHLTLELVGRPRPSTFVATCAYTWVCLTKARGANEGRVGHFCFAADCRTRLDPPVPDAYFGNCIGGTSASVGESELSGGESKWKGLVSAAEAIREAIRRLEEGGPGPVVEEVKALMRRAVAAVRARERLLSVAGSPRLCVYGVDFGWGRPRKVEMVSIESTSAISLAESRDEEGGVEIGMVGPEDEMVRFASFFQEALKSL
ncbi:hypothetical protein H6P81_011612 [Aristolochia fimbriata]|uniref:Uncharacterized protein n=1 Tax=Aristolochia fimbriata TaxID=158543 RepID=A0AAV7EVK3_ARIFI|nr:hypothetical protein H6P81_011612 [Aristolochia fimbriata]